MRFKPLLAPRESPKTSDFFKKLPYPLMVSPKLDGIRGFTLTNGIVYSRTCIALPSYQVQEEFGNNQYLDGEIIEGNPSDIDVYNRTQSHVMSQDKPGELSYHVFDYIHPEWLKRPFYERLDKAKEVIAGIPGLHFVEHVNVDNFDELIAYEECQLRAGYEGIMMRNPIGYYKQNRATFNDGIIFKLKRFEDTEAIIIGFVEKLKNNNKLETDERGYAKRSSAKAGLVGASTVGKFIVLWNGIELDTAPGNFKHDRLKEIWDNKEKYIGKVLKIRFFLHGMKDLPRFPRAVGFRDKIDM